MHGPARRPALAAAALAVAHLACSRGDGPPAPGVAPAGADVQAAPAAAPEPPPLDPAIEQFQPEDPAEVARRAEREEARGRFRSLKDAFAGGGGASPAAAARLGAALSGVRPPAGSRWQLACRGAACRVAAAMAAPEAWQPALLASPEVQRVADRIAVDPDGRDRSAYVLLAAEDAAEGDDLVGALERELVASSEARACAAHAQATGTIRYELRVDATGFTYRADGDLPWPVVECVNGVLGELMRGVEVPPTARSAMRTVALRL